MAMSEASADGPIGTYECPLCGFDKPHTHGRITVEAA
jgi:hypothetical protein